MAEPHSVRVEFEPGTGSRKFSLRDEYEKIALAESMEA